MKKPSRESVILAMELYVCHRSQIILLKYSFSRRRGISSLIDACGENTYVRNLVRYNSTPEMEDDEVDRAVEMAIEAYARKPGQNIALDSEVERVLPIKFS